MSRTTFEQRRLRFNTLMQLESRRDWRIYTAKHDRAVIRRLDFDITEDDIHVTSNNGMDLYQFSVRRAVTRGIQRFLQLP